MKRCPECGREYDSSMMFCLDNGAELLYGPASSRSEPPTGVLAGASPSGVAKSAGGQFGDEPQTAILSVPPAAVAGDGDTGTSFGPEPDSLTGATDETDVKTAIIQPPAAAGGSDSTVKQNFSANRAAKPPMVVVPWVDAIVGGFWATHVSIRTAA